LTPAEQQERVHKALQEGRTQQALELARMLFKHDSSPENLELVRKTTMARARQLRSNGYSRDAATVLVNALDLGGADFLRQLAQELAACGDVQRAMELLQRVDDPAINTSVLAQAVDAAMRQGQAARNLLPDDLRCQFDLVRQAFAQLEAGQHEAARTALQGIGLQSPFLEWKLLLRGLLAYYQGDDARALENWQRLDDKRLPARLAGPFRFLLDPAFRQAQPAETQNQLQKVIDQLLGSPLALQLRNIEKDLAKEKLLAQAFRQAETLLPSLRQQAPALVNRLAACFFWAILNHGHPEDKERYLRVFGTPTDDPELHRLSALAMEHRHAWEPAHLAWQDLDAEVEKNPAWGTPEQRNRVRALIWSRMGENADARSEHADQFPAFFQRLSQKERSLKPAAEQCFKKSLALAPDQLEAHQALFQHYQDKKKTAKALQAGAELLARFPDHVLTLEAMGDLNREKENYQEALEHYERAVAVNPLEKRLRNKVGTAQLFLARALACAGEFDEARAHFQAVLSREEGNKNFVLCKWAACEFKAQNHARAEELILQARPEGCQILETAYALAIEAVRYQLPAPLRKRFTGEFNLALQEPASVATACQILATAGSLRSADVSYHGQQAHEKKVLGYLGRALPLSWTAEQLEAVCETLLLLDNRKYLKKILQRGKREFPDNPIFFLKEAEVILIDYGEPWKANRLLEQARRRTQDLPRGERQERLFDLIRNLQEMAGDEDMDHPMNLFGRMMDMMDEFDDGDDDY
jgi:tetratricopeptide (TPR) repeat protein